jgi:4-hydroxy-3-methylbut-2-enyl diphosphate reductase IspH
VPIVSPAVGVLGAPLCVRHEVVRNRHVVDELRDRGAVFVEDVMAVPEGSTVAFSAHGVARAVREEALRRGLRVLDAACPPVTKVHMGVRRHASQDREWARFPNIRAPCTRDNCYATHNRQDAVKASARDECDVILVVGSANSSNSSRLREVAERLDTPAYLVDDAADLPRE